MTTLVGIKAEKGKEGVILGSDISRTHTNWRPQGDVAYRQQTRSEGQKIYLNNSGDTALCMTGVFDRQYTDFLSDFIDGKFDLENILKNGFFPELLNLNLSRWDGKTPHDELINGLLIATRFQKKPELYTCWPLGKVEKRVSTSLGSGSGYALEYLSEQKEIIPRGIDIDRGIDLVVGSLDKASQDLYTGGLDIVVVTADKIYDLGKNIRSAVDVARTNAIKQAKENLI